MIDHLPYTVYDLTSKLAAQSKCGAANLCSWFGYKPNISYKAPGASFTP